MAKKVLTTIVACALVFSLFAIGASARTLVYDGADDLKNFTGSTTKVYNHQGDLSDETGSGRLLLAGGPDTWAEDGKLGIQNRVNGYDSIDVSVADLPLGDYELVVSFASNDFTEFFIADADADWATLTEELGTEATLNVKFSIVTTNDAGGRNAVASSGAIQNRYRLNAAAGQTYYVTGVKIYSLGGGAVTAPAAVGNTDAATDPSKLADTGVADVAVASAIALLAAGAVVFARKRK